MASINKTPSKTPQFTAGGAKASQINPKQQLKRLVLSCMLWEDSFYNSGNNISEEIKNLIPLVEPEFVSSLAIEAREKYKLRHVPLFIAREMARLSTHKYLVSKTLEKIIQRPDELTEYLSIYWKDGRCKLSKQSQKGLAKAFVKFNEYQLAKYNRSKEIKLRDVLFLSHAKPKDNDQALLWKRLIANELSVPETWEVLLSAGKNKKETWEKLITEKKIGGLAFLRNLRNMKEAGVDEGIIFSGLNMMNTERILPFRFISAAKYVPQWESEIEKIMMKCLNQQEKLKGKTILVIDISGSMGSPLSSMSELTRVDAACALAILAREKCENVSIYATAGDDGYRVHATAMCPPRHGFALADVIKNMNNKLGGGGIFLSQCLDYIYEKEKTADRVIVFTDEQDCDNKLSPDKANNFGKNNYIVNISVEINGIAYSKFTHINGFSESILDYISESEREEIYQ